ncbi:4'-phosphopantetheinyl transferase [Bradyrhizobium lablabi]|uniref:4'-phosphopantetheinyl transferase family protein n=1 Tax=Bradyrhizobium lablabi TaxID=722472 RepID=UPI001BAB9D3C|nr:4'-phosphopantetheinyl transferase superfamily protein [Bradyrhizobium lablabi]MBR0694308.1 4'-phosphopantetheinyl transferase superfamily protein [Bradyrhizobium lablabi]
MPRDDGLSTPSSFCSPLALLESACEREIVFSEGVPSIDSGALFPDEVKYIQHAVEKRRAEFGTARVCARHALSRLGIPPCSLVPRADRSPQWPPGVVGSISHTDKLCGVAVTTSPRIASLGLDLEIDAPLESELQTLICTSTERRWLDQYKSPESGHAAKILFSAKEAFYKCQYAITEQFLEFTDVELSIDLQNGSFCVSGIGRVGGEWDRVRRTTGKIRRSDGVIATLAVLEAINP